MCNLYNELNNNFIKFAVMRIEELYQCFLNCNGVSIDTRNITPDSLFFALKGERFDANEFAQEALKKGAKYVVVDNKNYYTDKEKMLFVSDSLRALQDLAKYHREQLGLPIISLTGSNGKTTTKELIFAVLSKKYKTQATKGNLNNHIGVPLTLLSIEEDTDVAIVEMGANHQKEIEFLCTIAQPDYGYITNFGRAHLEGFGGFEGVIKGKSELYDYLNENGKTAFINGDDEIQLKHSTDLHRLTFGIENKEVNYVFGNPSALPMASIDFKGISLQSELTGLYNIPNICAAVSIGTFFGVDIKDIQQAIKNYIPTNNRSQWIEWRSNKVLLDAYNANPSSMKAAIDNFAQLQDKSKLMILGDMFELGEESQFEHASIVKEVENKEIETWFIGNKFAEVKKANEKLQFFENIQEAKELLNQSLKETTILIKGSRGMALEQLISEK